MPRALTEAEKIKQRQKLLEKAKAIVLSQGVRKTSIEDITKASGMAKGLFYKHFNSKESFMYELLIDGIYGEIFRHSAKLIEEEIDFKANIYSFLLKVFDMKEIKFLAENFSDIEHLNMVLTEEEVDKLSGLEIKIYKELLQIAGIDTTRVFPEVVHNYFHILYMIKGSELMISEYAQINFEGVLESLANYILHGGSKYEAFGKNSGNNC